MSRQYKNKKAPRKAKATLATSSARGGKAPRKAKATLATPQARGGKARARSAKGDAGDARKTSGPAAKKRKTSHPPGPIIDEEGFKRYEIEKLLARQVKNGRVQYLVRWEGYAPEEDTWEPAEGDGAVPDWLQREFDASSRVAPRN